MIPADGSARNRSARFGVASRPPIRAHALGFHHATDRTSSRSGDRARPTDAAATAEPPPKPECSLIGWAAGVTVRLGHLSLTMRHAATVTLCVDCECIRQPARRNTTIETRWQGRQHHPYARHSVVLTVEDRAGNVLFRRSQSVLLQRTKPTVENVQQLVSAASSS